MQAERRRRRYPVPGDDLPPLEAPVATLQWGVVVFEDVESNPIGEAAMEDLYPHMRDEPGRFVWARWRVPSLQEVYRARPMREDEDSETKAGRGWWIPNRAELQETARRLRAAERAQRTRQLAGKDTVRA
jgi:hypothetical protein